MIPETNLTPNLCYKKQLIKKLMIPETNVQYESRN